MLRPDKHSVNNLLIAFFLLFGGWWTWYGILLKRLVLSERKQNPQEYATLKGNTGLFRCKTISDDVLYFYFLLCLELR